MEYGKTECCQVVSMRRDIMEKRFEKVKEFMDQMLTEQRTPGEVIRIHQDGKEVFAYHCGYRDLQTKEPLTGKEKFNIYSCSKVTTVVAALQLLEQGRYLLSTPVYDILPEYRNIMVQGENGELRKPENPVTIGNLFTMTGGFDYDLDREPVKRVIRETGGHAPTREVVRALAECPLQYEPGERFNYSYGHDILAGVVEVVSGKRFRDYVRENIFLPLDMKDCVYHVTEDMYSSMSSQYDFIAEEEGTAAARSGLDMVNAQAHGKADKGHFEKIAFEPRQYIPGDEYDSGGAGITATADDYVKLAACLANMGTGETGERILAPATVELMRTNALTEQQLKYFDWEQLRGYGYGLGVRTMIDRIAGSSLSSIGEFGWCGAAGAALIADPAEKLGVFFAQHMLNPREEYYMPRLRNVIYSCL